MLAVETGVPRLLPLNGIFTAATPCDTIKNPVSSFGGSLQSDPLPMKPENPSEKTFSTLGQFYFSGKRIAAM